MMPIFLLLFLFAPACGFAAEPVTVTGMVFGNRLCALQRAAALSMAAVEGEEIDGPPDAACRKKCVPNGERYITPDSFRSSAGEAWPLWKVDNPDALKDLCGKHVQVKGILSGRDETISNLRFLHASGVETLEEPPAPSLKPAAKNEQGRRILSDAFLPEARRYYDLLRTWDLGPASSAVAAETKPESQITGPSGLNTNPQNNQKSVNPIINPEGNDRKSANLTTNPEGNDRKSAGTGAEPKPEGQIAKPEKSSGSDAAAEGKIRKPMPPDPEVERNIKKTAKAAMRNDADESVFELLRAYRATLSRRDSQDIFDDGKMTDEHAAHWEPILKACRDELDLSLTGAIAPEKSACVAAASIGR